jgi:type IVB pilus formation R64 PilN family outer membrane protein
MANPKWTKGVAHAVIVAFLVTGCGTVQQQNKQAFDTTMKSIEQAQESAPDTQPVVTRTSSAWLMGEAVQVVPAESPRLLQTLSYTSPGSVTLVDIAAFVSHEINLPIDTAEVQYTSGQGASTATLPGASGVQIPPTPAQLFAGQQGTSQLPKMTVKYEGTARGLLDFAANKSGVFFKYEDGRGSFFRTMTKTIEIPALARKTTSSSSISATSGQGTSGSGTSSGSGNNINAGSSTGGISNSDEYVIDVWTDMEKTARIVAGANNGVEAKVSANKALGLLTISGSPSQVKNVEQWAKKVVENMSKQVAITATVYQVDITNEDYFQWDPTIIFNKMSSAYSLNLTAPQAPTIQSSLSPGGFGLTALNTSTATSNLNGTQVAFRALSTIGNVSGQIRQSIVTLNGQQAPLQIGKQRGYVYSNGAVQTANVGTTQNIQPGSVTVGFTAMFLPQVINDKIYLSMDVINSTLDGLINRGPTNAQIQTPDTTSGTFKQTFALMSGQAFMVTGVQQDAGANNKSGMGTPDNMIFGGGVGASSSKKLVAIVISAKVL